jgi:hypothetical protein
VISPPGFEGPRITYLTVKGSCPEGTPLAPDGIPRCEKLVTNAQSSRSDCGLDGLCPGDRIETNRSCGDTNPCPDPQKCEQNKCVLLYPGPDPDGSENDGQPDWFVDCGNDGICPCVSAQGMPAYYGPDGKTCLKGHSLNPDYKGPDADGSQGNGKFDGYWLAGFSTNRPMLGKNDDIWARAIVMKTGDTTVAMVSLDLVGFFHDQVLEVRKLVAADTKGRDIDYVLIMSTHNHEAPDSMGQWGPADKGLLPTESGINPKWMKYIIERTAQAILEAQANMKAAKLRAAKVNTGAEYLVRDSRDPVVIDDEMIVLHFTEAATNQTIATVVNWGNHPEVLGGANNILTSDFPHYLREGIEKGIPKAKDKPAQPGLGGICIFKTGSVGGLMTPLGVSGKTRDGEIISGNNFAKADAMGIMLAEFALKALESSEEISDPKLSFWAKTFLVPVENTIFQLAMQAGLLVRQVYNYDPDIRIGPDNLPELMTEIALVRLGSVSFFSLPGEVLPEVLIGGYDCSKSHGPPCVNPKNPNPPDLKNAPKGPYLKDQIPGKYKLTLQLANDELGYMVPPYDFKLGSPPYIKQAEGDHYEETNSVGPQAVPRLLEAYDILLKRVSTSP